MNLRRSIARSLAKNSLYGLLFVAALVGINANVEVERQTSQDGQVECWNPHTAQVTTEIGSCPVPVNPYK